MRAHPEQNVVLSAPYEVGATIEAWPSLSPFLTSSLGGCWPKQSVAVRMSVEQRRCRNPRRRAPHRAGGATLRRRLSGVNTSFIPGRGGVQSWLGRERNTARWECPSSPVIRLRRGQTGRSVAFDEKGFEVVLEPKHRMGEPLALGLRDARPQLIPKLAVDGLDLFENGLGLPRGGHKPDPAVARSAPPASTPPP